MATALTERITRIRELVLRLGEIINAVRETLHSCPPELAGDLIEQGITMAGGGALLRGIGAAINESVGLPCRVADEPLTAVARGTGVFLDNLSEVKSILEQAEEN